MRYSTMEQIEKGLSLQIRAAWPGALVMGLIPRVKVVFKSWSTPDQGQRILDYKQQTSCERTGETGESGVRLPGY